MRSANSSCVLSSRASHGFGDLAIADSLQADPSVSDWLVSFSPQYPIHTPNSGALSQVWHTNSVYRENPSIVEHRGKRTPYHNCLLGVARVDASKPGSWHLRAYHPLENMTSCWLRFANFGKQVPLIKKSTFLTALDGWCTIWLQAIETAKFAGSARSSAATPPRLRRIRRWCSRLRPRGAAV
jgi:hypothetical protein